MNEFAVGLRMPRNHVGQGKVENMVLWESCAKDTENDHSAHSPVTAGTVLTIVDDACELFGEDSDSGDEFAEDDDFAMDDDDLFSSDDEDYEPHRTQPHNPSLRRPNSDSRRHLPELPMKKKPLSDLPPCQPRRCFDEDYEELRRINAKSRAKSRGCRRDELAQSEHVGGALRNLSDHSAKSFRPRAAPSRTRSSLLVFQSEMNRFENARLTKHKKVDSLSMSEHNGRSIRRISGGHHHMGQVTLRASRGRVLKGNRELSTSEHLRRSAPSSSHSRSGSP